MNEVKKFVKKNKKLSIIIGVILGIVILFFLLKGWVFPDISKSLYGNRLDGISKVPIEKNQISDLKSALTKESFVANVSYELKGRLINIEVDVQNGADGAKAKELGKTALASFTEEQKKYYDIQIFLTSSDYSINYIGYKHKTSDEFIWTNN